MVPLFSLFLPFLSPRSISVSLLLCGRRVPLLCLFEQRFSLSLALVLSLCLSFTVGPRLFLSEREPLDGRTKARRLLLSPAAFLPFRSSLSHCSTRHIFSLSLSLFAFLVSSLSLCRGGWFIGFIGAPARALRILFSNYTVTCNRPCQLAAPFFRSSSARFFFFSLATLARDPTWRATPSKGSLREGREKRSRKQGKG